MSEAVSGTGKAPGSIQVIRRMMSLLDALAASPDAASLKQLALATELHPSAAHPHFGGMSTARFVERQDAGLSPRFACSNWATSSNRASNVPVLPLHAGTAPEPAEA